MQRDRDAPSIQPQSWEVWVMGELQVNHAIPPAVVSGLPAVGGKEANTASSLACVGSGKV